jgi:hypothetical protein
MRNTYKFWAEYMKGSHNFQSSENIFEGNSKIDLKRWTMRVWIAYI